jgi:hypothetical protein
LARVARLGVGAAATGAAMGSLNSASAQTAYAEAPPAAELLSRRGFAGNSSATIDPTWKARHDAEVRMERAVYQQQRVRDAWVRGYTQPDPDLAVLKSVQPQFRACIMVDRAKRSITELQRWQDQIRQIREAPGHLIDSLVGKLLAEIGGAVDEA